MNNKGVINVWVWIVLGIIVLLVLLGLLLPAWGKFRMSLGACEPKGRCLPEGTLDEDMLAGENLHPDCKQLTKETDIEYKCYKKTDQLKGKELEINEEIIVEGSNFYFLEYPKRYEQSPWGDKHASTQQPSGITRLEFDRIPIRGSANYRLEAGRLYAFQGLMHDTDKRYCSIYLAQGDFNPGTDNYIRDIIKREVCDDPKNPQTLFFVPSKDHEGKTIRGVFIAKKNQQDSLYDDKIEVIINIVK